MDLQVNETVSFVINKLVHTYSNNNNNADLSTQSTATRPGESRFLAHKLCHKY